MSVAPRLVLVAVTCVAVTCVAGCVTKRSVHSVTAVPTPALSSIAWRVHDMDAMRAFYGDVLGARFHEVDTGGIRSQFAEWEGLTLKFVPIRDSTDFVGFPELQLGFTVPDVHAIIALAERHGGRQEGEVRVDGGRVHASVRDPDGNTIELYSK